MTERFAPIQGGRTGFYLAVAAIAVNAPRLVLAFLEVDGLAVGPAWRVALLGLTGIATGIVLTGGGAYLAHALAISRGGGRYRRLLAGIWLLVLTGSTALVAPMLVAGLGRESLPRVLPSSGLRWTWSAVAVVAVELVAAGSMAAQGAGESDRRRAEKAEAELLELARQRHALEARLAGRAGTAPKARPGRPGPRVPCRNGCGWTGRGEMAERGHQRACPVRKRRQAETEPVSTA